MSIFQLDPIMTIQRRYEPDAEALDRVVEILCRLLVEAPEGRVETGESGPVQRREPCLLTEPEG
jgi:hypothetical protein